MRRAGIAQILDLPLAVAASKAGRAEGLVARQDGQVFDLVVTSATAVRAVVAYEGAVAEQEEVGVGIEKSVACVATKAVEMPSVAGCGSVSTSSFSPSPPPSLLGIPALCRPHQDIPSPGSGDGEGKWKDQKNGPGELTKLECFALFKNLQLVSNTIARERASSQQPQRTSPHPLQGKTSSPSPGLSVYSSMMSAMFPTLHQDGLSRLLQDQDVCGSAISMDVWYVARRRKKSRSSREGRGASSHRGAPIVGSSARWAVCGQGDPRLRATLFGGGRRSGSAEGC